MKLTTTLKIVLCAAGLMVPAGLAVPSAEAASKQTICNSTASDRDFDVDFKNSPDSVPMYVGRCESVFTRGGTIVRIGHSYRVKYRKDGTTGSYSECRNNSDFTPWSKADTITFKTYDSYYC